MKYDRFSIIITLIGALCIAAFAVVFESREVYSVSMEPTLGPGVYVMVNRFAYCAGQPGRGDVVVMKPQHYYTTDLIKRIIGIPGDTIRIHDHTVYVNGTALEEPYIKEPVAYEYQLLEVPDDYYFVLGDNRNHSDDSHEGWLLPETDIKGKACFTCWPPECIGLLGSSYR